MGVKRRLNKFFNNFWIKLLIVVFVLVLIVYSFPIILSKGDIRNKIAIIPIKGLITVDGMEITPFTGGSVSSTEIVDFINAAEKDKTIKGIVLEINSPGGAVVASKEIADAVKKANKPVIAWIREVGASGAYWIASSSDYIIADPLSITGSIGVASSYLEFSGLFEEYGVGYERLVAGKYKDTGSPFRKLEDDEKVLLQEKINKIYDYFTKSVADNRKLDENAVRNLSNGIFYLGQEAFDLGLVDELGGKEEAINKVKEKAGIKDAKIVRYETKKTLIDVLRFLGMDYAYSIGKGIGSELSNNENLIRV